MHLRVQLAILVASALVALASWQLLLKVNPIVPVPEELFGLTQPNTEQVAQLRAHHRLNISYALAIYGALAMLAGLPAIVGQSASTGQRPLLKRLIGFVVVAVLAGGGCGLLISWIGHYGEDWLPITLDPLVRVSTRLLVSLLPFALAASLLAVLFTSNLKQFPGSFLGGLLGALLASFAFALVAGLAFQNENSDVVLPPGTSCQLLLFFFVPWLIWATIVYQLRGASALAHQPAEHALEPI